MKISRNAFILWIALVTGFIVAGCNTGSAPRSGGGVADGDVRAPDDDDGGDSAVGREPEWDDDDHGGGDLDSPATVGGELDVDWFTIDVGETTRVTSDLVIRASGNVEIGGQLIADPTTTPGGNGYSISIIADGDIEITGTIQAGAGADGAASGAAFKTLVAAQDDDEEEDDDADGGDGGFVELDAAGDLTLGEFATITCGSGGAGAEANMGGAGGSGGDLMFAAGGTFTASGVLTVGNGGWGAEPGPEPVHSNDTTWGGRGGDSGFLFIKAADVDWPGYDVEANAVDPTQMTLPVLVGGYGGHAPVNISISDLPLPGEIPLLGEIPLFGLMKQADALVQRVHFFERRRCPGENCWFRAADGGDGFVTGGNGGEIVVTLVQLVDGQWDAPIVEGHGGKGGDLRQPSRIGYGDAVAVALGTQGLGFAGNGGKAFVYAPDGRAGDASHNHGGRGGLAHAKGGDGGSASMDLPQFGGWGGMAYAQAGNGGEGLDDCNPGGGGDGGKAVADGGRGGNGGFAGRGGEAKSVGGWGGAGGDGGNGRSGNGGKRGDPLAEAGLSGLHQFGEAPPEAVDTEEPGEDGRDGSPDKYDCS